MGCFLVLLMHYGGSSCCVHKCSQNCTRTVSHISASISTSVACAVGPSVTTFSTDFSFQNLVSWNLNFQRQKSFKNSISPTNNLNPNLTKQIPLNPAHQDLSNNTKDTFQFLRKFQLRFNLIFSEEIIQYSRTFAPQLQMSWN
jgi:hypothetical protein